MTLDEWYELVVNDADRRHLPDLRPVLKGLHGAAGALRAASWNDDARGPSSQSGAPDVTPSQTSQPQASQSQQQPQSSQPQSQQPSPRASS
jgi:hypothetical protein